MIYGGKELAAAFRTVRGNTIKVVEELPDAQFDFVAAPGLRTVRQLVAHIVFAPNLYLEFNKRLRITTLVGFDFPAALAKGAAFEQQLHTKAALLEMLRTEGEAIGSWMESLDEAFLGETFTDTMGKNPKSRLESLMSIKEHEMHHRAQLMLILRMLGGESHLTRERKARAAARASGGASTVTPA